MSWKKFFFFLAMPIMVPIALFINSTYEWWMDLSGKNKFFFFLLAPVYGPLAGFLYLTYDAWAKLAD